MNHWTKSLKGKFLILLSVPLLSLVVVSGVSYSIINENIDEIHRTHEYGNVLYNYGLLYGESKEVPRQIWAALGKANDFEGRKASITRTEAAFDRAQKAIETMNEHKKIYEAELSEKEPIFASTVQIEEGFKEFRAHFDELKPLLMRNTQADNLIIEQAISGKMAVISKKISDPIDVVVKSASLAIDHRIEKNQHSNKTTLSLLALFSLGTILVIMFISYVSINSIIKRITEIISEVTTSSGQVNVASHQISNASQQLASVSQSQASSIEQTSAALAEMSGMVEKNTQNAEKSAGLANTMKSNAETSAHNASELIASMEQILESNKKIEQLVKVIEEIGEKTSLIDEIVFQTKLLSFNASVEAERAGDHGRGFAVVAQEVGNLAQMSGKSALEISSIVKSSVKEAAIIAAENKEKVETGAKLVEQIAETLKQMDKTATNVYDLSHQVLEASKEQNTGISQINISVDMINKTTQETAATAEEAASSAEELNSQAESLQMMVQKLNEIIYGSSTHYVTPQQVTAQVIPMPTMTRPTRTSMPMAKASGASSHENYPVTAWDKL